MKSNVVLVVLVLVLVSVACADEFERIYSDSFIGQAYAPDARSEGMGMAFTAVAEGPAGLFWNPATQLEGHTVAVGYHRADHIIDTLEFSAIGAAVEIGYLRLGVYQNELTWDTVINTSYRKTMSDYRSHVRVAGLAIDVGRLIFGEETTVFASAGVNFKSFESKWDNETFAKASDKDAGFMLGTRLFLGDTDDVHRGWVGWRLGGVLTNTDRAEVEVNWAAIEDKADPLFVLQRGRVGLALEGRHGWHYSLGHRLRWLITADWEKGRLDDGWSDATVNRYGAELMLLGLVAGRVGQVDWGEGNYKNGMTYGAGLRFSPQGSHFGVSADWASVPYEPTEYLGSPFVKQRLDRYSAAAWLDF
ncbi:hypothetical protein H8E07_18615 [bacterium]|nr:hypothetical protein [bacterium]